MAGEDKVTHVLPQPPQPVGAPPPVPGAAVPLRPSPRPPVAARPSGPLPARPAPPRPGGFDREPQTVPAPPPSAAAPPQPKPMPTPQSPARPPPRAVAPLPARQVPADPQPQPSAAAPSQHRVPQPAAAPPRPAPQPLQAQISHNTAPPPAPPPAARAPHARPGAIRAIDWGTGRPLNGRYRMLQKLGEGGMGAVWLCEDILLRRKVALKTLFADRNQVTEEDLERFRREVAIAHAINHENIARTYDLGEAAGVHYLTMELLEGQTLVDRLKKGEPMSAQELREMAIPLCNGLRAAHKAAVVHRDLKPANVMLVNDARKVVIMDFGIAAAVDEPQDPDEVLQPVANVPWEVTSAGRGTPTYMAPEQWAGQRGDQRTDIYALGIIFYVCLTKKVPFKATSSQELADLHQTQLAPRVEALAPATDRLMANLIAQCMAKRPEDRPQSIDEVLDILERGKGRRAYVLQTVGMSLALALVLGLVGLGLWSLAHRTVIREMRPSIGRLAELVALQVDAADLDTVLADKKVDSPAFERVHRVYERYYKRYPELKSLYAMRPAKEPGHYTIAVDLYPKDTDRDGNGAIDEDEAGSLPGEDYDGSDSPGMAETAQTVGAVADDDFTSDKWGISLSGYCAVFKDGKRTPYFVGADASNVPMARFKIKLIVILGALWVLLSTGFAVVRARLGRRKV